MRLSTLEPVLEVIGEGRARLSFACPAHGVGAMRSAAADFAGWPDRVDIQIATPLEGPPLAHVWHWNGERDFEKLTITPSVHYFEHWHGHVTDGEVTIANG